jgi:hypothetical protein
MKIELFIFPAGGEEQTKKSATTFIGSGGFA